MSTHNTELWPEERYGARGYAWRVTYLGQVATGWHRGDKVSSKRVARKAWESLRDGPREITISRQDEHRQRGMEQARANVLAESRRKVADLRHRSA